LEPSGKDDLRGQEARVRRGTLASGRYWAAFMNLLDPLPKDQCPMPEDWRPAFVSDPHVKAALDPVLVEHRDAIFKGYFRSPMEF
jgi:hypothetical protein